MLPDRNLMHIITLPCTRFAGDADVEDESEGEGIEEVTLKRMNHRRRQEAMKLNKTYVWREELFERDR